MRTPEILVVQNKAPDVHLGLWHKPLVDAGLEPVIIDPSKTCPDIAKYAGVILLGGPSSINDMDDPKVPPTLDIADQTIKLNKAGLGSCLGLQAFAKVVGGTVDYCNPKQNGIFDANGNRYTAEFTDAALEIPILEGLPTQSIEVFQAHEKEVLLPNKLVMAWDRYGIIQFAQLAKKVFGAQHHPEIKDEQVLVWKENAPGMDAILTPEVVQAFHEGYPKHVDYAELLINNWTRHYVLPDLPRSTVIY